MPLKPTDLRTFYDENYLPPNLNVVATGNVDIDQVVGWAADAFDDLPMSSRKPVREAPVFHSGIKVYPRKGDQLYAAFGFPGVAAPHPDRFAQSMLGVILGAGTSSRLYQKIREENGLVYSIYAMSVPFTDTGAFSIYFSTSSENSEKVFQLVTSELRRLKADGLERDELSRAKHWLKGMIVRKLEPTDNRMYFLGEQFLQTGKLMTEDQILQSMEAVTEEDVARCASNTLVAERMCTALHTSLKAGRSISKSVASLDF
jgi:predicted Zn-dependent peptidase